MRLDHGDGALGERRLALPVPLIYRWKLVVTQLCVRESGAKSWLKPLPTDSLPTLPTAVASQSIFSKSPSSHLHNPPPPPPFTAPTAPGPSGTASPPEYYSARGNTARSDSAPTRPRHAGCSPSETRRCNAGNPRPRAGRPFGACCPPSRRGCGCAGRPT